VADGSETGAQAGFLLQSAAKLHGILGHLEGRFSAKTTAADQARRMPCRPGRQLGSFQQHDIPPAKFGQMIGDAATDHAAANDHYLRPGRQ
jgi:hypothetical protein